VTLLQPHRPVAANFVPGNFGLFRRPADTLDATRETPAEKHCGIVLTLNYQRSNLK